MSTPYHQNVWYLPRVWACAKCATAKDTKHGWWYEIRGQMVWCCNECHVPREKGAS